MARPRSRNPGSRRPRRPAQLTLGGQRGAPVSPAPLPTRRPRFKWMTQCSNFAGPGRMPRSARFERRRRTLRLYQSQLTDGEPLRAWKVVRRNPAAFLEDFSDIIRSEDIVTALASQFNAEGLELMLEWFQAVWTAEHAAAAQHAGVAETAVRQALSQVRSQEAQAGDADIGTAPVATGPRTARARTNVPTTRTLRSAAAGRNITFQAL